MKKSLSAAAGASMFATFTALTVISAHGVSLAGGSVNS